MVQEIANRLGMPVRATANDVREVATKKNGEIVRDKDDKPILDLQVVKPGNETGEKINAELTNFGEVRKTPNATTED